MRSQPQLRNYKYIINEAIHELDKLNSFPAIAFEMFKVIVQSSWFITGGGGGKGLQVRVVSSACNSVLHIGPIEMKGNCADGEMHT